MGRTAKVMTRLDAIATLHRAETRLLEDVLTAATGREVLQQVVDELGEVRAFLELPPAPPALVVVTPAERDFQAYGEATGPRQDE